MRSFIAVATLFLILGMFFFQSGCSSSQQPDKQSLQQKNEDITSNPSISDEQSIEPPSPAKLVTATPNKNEQKYNSLTNSIGIKLIRIPKGKFVMGSPPEEKGSDEDENRHEVTISRDYYLGIHEVTQAQYKQIMEENPSEFQGDVLNERDPETNRVVKKVDSANHPVEQVFWVDAVEFCQRLSALPEEKKAGRVYRLPTEAEWEYACRAGTTTPFHFGSQLNGRQANCDGTLPYGTETKGPNLEKTTPVGKYPANAWGLHDMHGNVLEWCADWYGDYPSGSVTDPIGPATGSICVMRGGGWSFGAVGSRSAFRGRFAPSVRAYVLGFRVALSSSGIPK